MTKKNKYYEFVLKAEEYIGKKNGVPQKFSDIWNYISDSLNLTEEERKNLVGEFHLTLTLHKKFVYLGNLKKQLWNLKKYYSLKDLKKISKKNVFYDNDDEIDLETDMVDYVKINANPTKVLKEETALLEEGDIITNSDQLGQTEKKPSENKK